MSVFFDNASCCGWSVRNIIAKYLHIYILVTIFRIVRYFALGILYYLT